MNGMDEIYFLMQLCPRMKHLKMASINNTTIPSFVRTILMKMNKDRNLLLRSLCLHGPTDVDEMIQKLQDMINGEKLFRLFTIKHVLDNIYLQ